MLTLLCEICIPVLYTTWCLPLQARPQKITDGQEKQGMNRNDQLITFAKITSAGLQEF